MHGEHMKICAYMEIYFYTLSISHICECVCGLNMRANAFIDEYKEP